MLGFVRTSSDSVKTHKISEDVLKKLVKIPIIVLRFSENVLQLLKTVLE